MSHGPTHGAHGDCARRVNLKIIRVMPVIIMMMPLALAGSSPGSTPTREVPGTHWQAAAAESGWQTVPLAVTLPVRHCHCHSLPVPA